MRSLLALTAGAAFFLTTGCAAGHPATQPDLAGPAATAAGSSTPSSAVTSTTAPTTRSAPGHATTAPATRSGSARPTPAPPLTRQVVIRPVTAAGRVAAGFTLAPSQDSKGELICSGPDADTGPSGAAVDDGIVACGPSSSYALACWNGRLPRTALCLRDPWQRTVVRLAVRDPMPAVAAAPRVASPLGLELSDGTRCARRSGGAWVQPAGYPQLVGTYLCTGGRTLWGAYPPDGIDRTHGLWTVRVWSGTGSLRTMPVRTVYFVGTAS
jgi:hypothetical protein